MNSVGRHGLVAGTALAVAVGVLAGTAFAAGEPAAAAALREAKRAEQQMQGVQRAQGAPSVLAEVPVETPTFPLYGVNKKNAEMDLFFPNRAGGFDPAYNLPLDYSVFADFIDVDNDKDG